MPEYSVIIPAFNEESVIVPSLTQVRTFMESFATSYEIIVVDDGSTDSTAQKVQNYSQDNTINTIKLLQLSHKGKASAVRAGVLEAKGKFICITDADMATPISELKRLMVWLTDNDADLVIASREGVGALRKDEPLVRHLMGLTFNVIVRFLLLPEIRDTQCGFKVMRGDVAKIIFNKMVLFGDSLPDIKVPRVSAFDVELLIIAKRLNYKIRSVPVSWQYHKKTKLHPFRDTLFNLWDVLRIKMNDLKRVYSS